MLASLSTLTVNLNVILKTLSSQTWVKFPNGKLIKYSILAKDVKIALLLKNWTLSVGMWEEGLYSLLYHTLLVILNKSLLAGFANVLSSCFL